MWSSQAPIPCSTDAYSSLFIQFLFFCWAVLTTTRYIIVRKCWCRWRKAATTRGRGNCAWAAEQSDTARQASSLVPDRSHPNDNTGRPTVHTPNTRERSHALSLTLSVSSGPYNIRLWQRWWRWPGEFHRCQLLHIGFSYCSYLVYSYYPNLPIGKVWIYRLLFVCVFVCVYTVTDFFAEDKASGFTFCTAVHRRPRQGISHFCELCSPRSPKSDESVSTRATPTRM